METNIQAAPTKEELAEIRGFTGEAEAAGGARVPSLMFNGETGVFARQKIDIDGVVDVDEKGEPVIEEIGGVIDLVIVKVRRKVSTNSNHEEPLVYSNEHDAAKEEIALYSDETREQVNFGLFADLKPQYQTLRMCQVLYVFFQQRMYKLNIRGTSLDPFWKYLATFTKKDTVLRYKTMIGVEDEEKEIRGKIYKYKIMKFARGDVMPKWRDIWEELKTLDTQISSTAVKRANLLPAPENIQQPDPGDTAAAISEPPNPIDAPAEPPAKEEEIKVEDIPF